MNRGRQGKMKQWARWNNSRNFTLTSVSFAILIPEGPVLQVLLCNGVITYARLFSQTVRQFEGNLYIFDLEMLFRINGIFQLQHWSYQTWQYSISVSFGTDTGSTLKSHIDASHFSTVRLCLGIFVKVFHLAHTCGQDETKPWNCISRLADGQNGTTKAY